MENMSRGGHAIQYQAMFEMSILLVKEGAWTLWFRDGIEFLK